MNETQTESNKPEPAAAPQTPMCSCKDRAASACPGEWEPGCDLGNNEQYVRAYREDPATLKKIEPTPEFLERVRRIADDLLRGTNHTPTLRDAALLLQNYYLAASQATEQPIDMVLHCPACGMQHIDAPEHLDRAEIVTGRRRDGTKIEDMGWDNPPHRSHLCRGCGHIWRPADVPTNGVAAVKTNGKNDSPVEKDRLRTWPFPAAAPQSGPSEEMQSVPIKSVVSLRDELRKLAAEDTTAGYKKWEAAALKLDELIHEAGCLFTARTLAAPQATEQPTLQQISDYLHGLDDLQRQVVEREARALRTEQPADRAQRDELQELIDSFPELNLSNYDDVDVDRLNAWGIEVVAALARKGD